MLWQMVGDPSAQHCTWLLWIFSLQPLSHMLGVRSVSFHRSHGFMPLPSLRSLGELEGEALGDVLGNFVGAHEPPTLLSHSVGESVGASVGAVVGDVDGIRVGDFC